MTKRITLNSLRPTVLWRRYLRHLQHSIVPKPYSHQVTMDLVVKKGQKSGTALIPCTIYAMDHSIDLNPALIRKTTKESVTSFDPEAKLRFVEDDSIDTYVVKGTDVQIHVKLADQAKADTLIPVQFGVNKADVAHRQRTTILLVAACAWATVYLVFDRDYVVRPLLDWMTRGLTGVIPAGGLLPDAAGTALVWATKAIAVVVIWVFFIPKIIYKAWKLGQWYTSVKDRMVKTPYAP